MISAHDLDYSPLTRRPGLGARLRAVTGDTRLTIGATLAVLLAVVPTVILVALLATVDDVDSGGIWVLGLLIAAGLWVSVDVLRQAGGTDALRDFAEVNDLLALGATTAPQYAGSLFASGLRRIDQGVRTTEAHFVEVGDSFPTRAPQHARAVHRPELYLRARLSGPTPHHVLGADLVAPELHERLTDLAGPYSVEVSGVELTVFGARALEIDDPDRIQEALSLALALAAVAETHVGTPPAPSGPTPSGIPIPTPERTTTEPASTRGRHPVAVVAAILGLLVLGSLAFAVVLSILDDGLLGNPGAAQVVVAVVVSATLAVVAWVIRRLMTPRPDEDHLSSGDEER